MIYLMMFNYLFYLCFCRMDHQLKHAKRDLKFFKKVLNFLPGNIKWDLIGLLIKREDIEQVLNIEWKESRMEGLRILFEACLEEIRFEIYIKSTSKVHQKYKGILSERRRSLIYEAKVFYNRVLRDWSKFLDPSEELQVDPYILFSNDLDRVFYKFRRFPQRI